MTQTQQSRNLRGSRRHTLSYHRSYSRSFEGNRMKIRFDVAIDADIQRCKLLLESQMAAGDS